MRDLQLIQFPTELQPVTARLNDYEFEDRDLKTLEGPTRRRQDVVKIIITKAASNPVIPAYGSAPPGVSRDTPDFQDRLKESTIEAMAFLDAQDKSTREDEKISNITVQVSVDPADPRSKIMLLSVKLADGQTIQTASPL